MWKEKSREKLLAKKRKKNKKMGMSFVKNKTNTGQALVEFVIILPIFIFMIFSCLDLGKILYYKNNLESKMDDVITLYKDNKNDSEIKEFIGNDIDFFISTNDDYLEFQLSKEVDLVTPGLNLVLGSPYYATTKRVIYNE
jgi:hypothetical protein